MLRSNFALAWIIFIYSTNSRLHTARNHCLSWNVFEAVIRNCSLEMNPRCVHVETPDKCQKKISCNLTGTSSDASFLGPTFRYESCSLTENDWVRYYKSLCVDLCTLTKESTPWPGSDSWLNETAFDVEIRSHDGGPVITWTNIKIVNEDYATYILDYFTDFPSNIITATTHLVGCHESITDPEIDEFPDVYWCTFGTRGYRLPHWGMEGPMRRRGICTDVSVSECTKTVMCNVSTIASYLREYWNEQNVCGLACWMFNAVVGTSTEAHDFKIGTFDQGNTEWEYFKVYGVDRDQSRQIMNTYLNPKLMAHRGNVSLTASRSSPCDWNLVITEVKVRQLYGQLWTVYDSKPGCTSYNSTDDTDVEERKCVMHVECFNRRRFANANKIWHQMIWMYLKSIQWTGFDIHRSVADTEMCIKFSRDDTCHPVGKRPLNETFFPYMSVYEVQKHANYIRLTTKFENCIVLSNGSAKLVGPLEVDIFPNVTAGCLKWNMQERVDRIGNCSLERNPRCSLHLTNVCEKKIVCELNGTTSDYYKFRPRNITDLPDFLNNIYFPSICADMCTLYRETLPLPVSGHWLHQTHFHGIYEDAEGRIVRFDNYRIMDEIWAKSVLETFTSNHSLRVGIQTRLEGCDASLARIHADEDVPCSGQFSPESTNPYQDCDYRRFRSGCYYSPIMCQEREYCTLTPDILSSDTHICTFLCHLYHKAVGHDAYIGPEEESHFDFNVSYLDPSTNRIVTNIWYNSRRRESIRMLNLILYSYLNQSHDHYYVNVTAIKKGCDGFTSAIKRQCRDVEYYQQYGEMTTINDTMRPDCSYHYDQNQYENCTVRLECQMGGWNTQKFCHTALWMYKKSIEWTNFNLDTAWCKTMDMRLEFHKRIGTRMLVYRERVNGGNSDIDRDSYENYLDHMNRHGRNSSKIVIWTFVHYCYGKK